MEGSGAFVSNNTECCGGETVEVMGATSSSTGAHKHAEYVTACEGGMLSSGCSASTEQRTYGLWLEQERKRCSSEEEFLTAVSNPTWTEVAPTRSNSVEGSSSSMPPDEKRENQQFFEEVIKKQSLLRRDINYRWQRDDANELEKLLFRPGFFMDFGGRLAVGKKIAQGGQAEIYEALFDGEKPIIRGNFGRNFEYLEVSLVLKVFLLEQSESFRVAWANKSKNIYEAVRYYEKVLCCFVMNCTLLKDGRFAFLMRSYWGDLRTAINIQILKDKTYLKPPFPLPISTSIMFQIATGISFLHRKGILHKDLKAANVLVPCDFETYMRSFETIPDDGRMYYCDIADFESGEGVMGTGFWRAPEVMGILKSRAKDKYTNPTIWTEKVDVYSFAMTCYEVLSGDTPFRLRDPTDYNIGDERPPLPDYVDEEIQDLLKRCWDSEPSKRPSFDIICDELMEFGTKKKKYCESITEDKRDADAKEWLRWRS